MAATSTVAILPPAKTTFFDDNGVPLALGSVTFYIPATSTPKDTWTNSTGVTLNTNPVLLDAAGRALIWGFGSYRQLVKDSLGNTIWDQVTNFTAPTGNLIGLRTFINTAVYTPTVGTNGIIVEVTGAGGGGGGSPAAGGSQASCGGSGGAGGYARLAITSAFSGVTMTVGANGTGGAAGANAGTAGGTSSFGALVSATGGAGGSAGTLVTPPSLSAGTVIGGLGSSGSLNLIGGAGHPGLMFTTGVILSSDGGGSFYGPGALGRSGAGLGNSATNPGGGGCGGITAASGAAAAGGNGADGMIVVWEYN